MVHVYTSGIFANEDAQETTWRAALQGARNCRWPGHAARGGGGGAGTGANAAAMGLPLPCTSCPLSPSLHPNAPPPAVGATWRLNSAGITIFRSVTSSSIGAIVRITRSTPLVG